MLQVCWKTPAAVHSVGEALTINTLAPRAPLNSDNILCRIPKLTVCVFNSSVCVTPGLALLTINSSAKCYVFVTCSTHSCFVKKILKTKWAMKAAN